MFSPLAGVPRRARSRALAGSIGLMLSCATLLVLPAAAPGAAQAGETPLSGAPSTSAMPSVAAPAQAPIAREWSRPELRALRAAIERADAEGLNASDYNLIAVRTMLERDAQPADTMVADAAALTLARDFLMGRVGDRTRFGWYIERDPNEAASLPARLDAARRDGTLDAFYAELLPTDRRYAALRDELATASGAARDRIRANMERWRWMPRDLGDSYVYVNVPSYQLALVDDGAAVSTYDVMVGKTTTPTPALAADASSLVVNPSWTVPKSIAKAKNLRPGSRGFTYVNGMFRQAPGPRNALGKIKVNMPNDHAIYLHDTPAKGGFAADERTLSAGCIRVKDIEAMAGELMAMTGGDMAPAEDALAGSATRTVRLGAPVPVYIVYFTVDGAPDGGAMTVLGDPYGQDSKLAKALGGSVQMADAGRGGGEKALHLR